MCLVLCAWASCWQTFLTQVRADENSSSLSEADFKALRRRKGMFYNKFPFFWVSNGVLDPCSFPFSEPYSWPEDPLLNFGCVGAARKTQEASRPSRIAMHSFRQNSGGPAEHTISGTSKKRMPSIPERNRKQNGEPPIPFPLVKSFDTVLRLSLCCMKMPGICIFSSCDQRSPLGCQWVSGLSQLRRRAGAGDHSEVAQHREEHNIRERGCILVCLLWSVSDSRNGDLESKDAIRETQWSWCPWKEPYADPRDIGT